MGRGDRKREILREITKKIKIFFKIFKIGGRSKSYVTFSVK